MDGSGQARLDALEAKVAALEAALARQVARAPAAAEADVDGRKGYSRRQLLGAGTAVAAGAAGVVLGSPSPAAALTPATEVTFTPTGSIQATNVQGALAELDGEKQATAWLDIRLFGGKGDGSFDNTAALNLAAAFCGGFGGGTILLPPGHYRFSGVVTIPSGVDLCGTGGHRQGAGWFGSVLEATTASSQLVFRGTGGESGNFIVDGRDVADPDDGKGLVHMDFTVERLFSALHVVRSHGTGMVIDKAQNCTFVALQVSHCSGDGLVLDLGAGGNAFLRNEVNASGGNGVVIRQSGTSPEVYSSPQHNYFLHCIVERGPYPDGDIESLLHVTHGHGNTFNHCVFALGPPNTARSGALVIVSNAAVNFELCRFFYETEAGVGVRNDSAGVHLYTSNWFDVPTAIEWNGTAHGNVVGTLEYGALVTARWSGTGAHTNLSSVSSRQLLARIEPNATFGLRVTRAGERGYRFDVGNSGEISLGDGTANAPKASWRLQSGGRGWETPDDVLLNGGALALQQVDTSPVSPPAGRAAIYVQDDKLVVAYNDAGTLSYRWMPLSGTTVGWTHQTTAP